MPLAHAAAAAVVVATLPIAESTHRPSPLESTLPHTAEAAAPTLPFPLSGTVALSVRWSVVANYHAL
jgi:hypothetical protein